jgi:DNA (cytosine-5)-methyltransferase 1
LRSIELFVGAGGLALGTARAGFEHAVVIENNATACSTLRMNKSNNVRHVQDWKIVESPVENYDFATHRGEVDVVFGGPPCQPFSLGGRHRGHDDERNLFPEAVRAVRETRPLAFMFENVRGLKRQSFAQYLRYLELQLRRPTVIKPPKMDWVGHLERLEKIEARAESKDLGYNVSIGLLNAADFGVPQHRHRVFIVGITAGLGIQYSFPDPTHGRIFLLYDKWISGEYWDRHRVPKSKRPPIAKKDRSWVERLTSSLETPHLAPWRTVRDALVNLPRIGIGHRSHRISDHYLNPGARSYNGHTGSPFDEPAKTLKAGAHGVPGGENTLRLDDGTLRYFSVRECARIQTFPDEWAFGGTWTEGMRRLGNAVPVDLATSVAKRLRDILLQPGVHPTGLKNTLGFEAALAAGGQVRTSLLQ